METYRRPRVLTLMGIGPDGGFVDTALAAEHRPGLVSVGAQGVRIDLSRLSGSGVGEDGVTLQLPVTITVPFADALVANLDERAGQALASGGTITKRLYRSDRNGTEYEELSVSSATVTMNNYRDATWEISTTASAREMELKGLASAGDWVKLVCFFESPPFDETFRFPLGLYYFRFPKKSSIPEMTTFELSGYSPEMLLLERANWDGIVVPKGTKILERIRSWLTGGYGNWTGFGFDNSRLVFPPDEEDVALTTPYVADPFGQDGYDKCRWLRIMNGMLAAGGFRAIYADNEGRLVVEKLTDVEDREPAATYNSRNFRTRFIDGNIDSEVDADGFANRVVVKSADSQDAVPIIAFASNNDPNSPLSTLPSGLGYVVQSEPIEYENIVSQAHAQRLAVEGLRRALRMNEQMSFALVPDLRRGPREAITARVYRGDVVVAEGDWIVSEYQIELPENREGPAQMSMSVARKELANLEVA